MVLKRKEGGQGEVAGQAGEERGTEEATERELRAAPRRARSVPLGQCALRGSVGLAGGRWRVPEGERVAQAVGKWHLLV